jgi:arylsulfatase/uncharacterized sulfatase
MRYRASVFFSLLLIIASIWQGSMAQAARPNIVFILADDLGLSDIAPYGSEIDTPFLIALAEGGVRFTNYHTAASCAHTSAGAAGIYG